jgi:hypothetical protein
MLKLFHFCIHCSCHLQEVCELEEGSVLRESSECVYGVGTENSGKLKNMGMSPVSDRKVGEEKR